MSLSSRACTNHPLPSQPCLLWKSCWDLAVLLCPLVPALPQSSPVATPAFLGVSRATMLRGQNSAVLLPSPSRGAESASTAAEQGC